MCALTRPRVPNAWLHTMSAVLVFIPSLLCAQEVKSYVILKGHTQPVRTVAFSSDGKLLATGAGDSDAEGGEVKLWDVTTCKEIELQTESKQGTFAVSFSPDGKMLATGEYRRIRLWNLATRKVEMVLKGHDGNVDALAFTPDGKHLYSSFRGTFGAFPMPGSVVLWNLATAKELKTLKQARAAGLAYSSRNETLAISSTFEETIEIWDTTKLNQRSQITGYKFGITALSLSSNGQALATGSGKRHYHESDQTTSWEGEVVIWDLITGKKLRHLDGINGLVSSVVFSPDDKLLASASFSSLSRHELKLWDVISWKAIAEIKGHELCVRAITFSPDGKMLASASDDLTVRLWRVSSK